jgi:hypothetical protein
MELASDWDEVAVHDATLWALAAMIARSPIVMPRPAALLPAGFDEVDAAILNWIATEARQLRSRCALM